MTFCPLHIDDAIAFVEETLREHLGNKKPQFGRLMGSFGCEVWIPEIAWRYWQTRPDAALSAGQSSTDLKVEQLEPFADAAWQMCRMGILRPGPNGGQAAYGSSSPGFGFSTTGYGRSWLRCVHHRPPNDPGRFALVLQGIDREHGPAFLRRAAEASACYRSGNYLACCAMAGAAAEAVLLNIASVKEGNAGLALKEYRKAGGRKGTCERILYGIGAGLRERFISTSDVISYWRDESSHGATTEITELEASFALTHLLRFAQLAHDNWSELTAARPRTAERSKT